MVFTNQKPSANPADHIENSIFDTGCMQLVFHRFYFAVCIGSRVMNHTLFNFGFKKEVETKKGTKYDVTPAIDTSVKLDCKIPCAVRSKVVFWKTIPRHTHPFQAC